MALNSYAVDLAPITLGVSATDTVLPIISANVDFAQTVQAIRHSGNRHPNLIVFTGGNPFIQVVMPARAALDKLGVSGKLLDNIELYLSTYASSVRQSGANNYSIVAGSGWAQIDRIDVRSKSLALATVTIIPFATDETSDPWTIAGSKTIPSLTTSPPVANVMANMAIGGTVQEGLVDFTVDFNHSLRTPEFDGRRYPSEVIYQGQSPTISGTHVGALALNSAVGVEGNMQTDLDFYLRENDEANEGLKATGIELAFSDALLQWRTLNLGQDQLGQCAFTVIGLSDSDTSPIGYASGATVATV